MSYIGTTKRDMEYLIDSVSEPGVCVKREVRIKPIHTVMGGVNIIYHFYKNGSRLFSVCILPKGGTLSNGSVWSNVEISVLQDTASSDVICKGDDGFRGARVLGQLAEKMYKTQNVLKNLQEKQTRIKAMVDGEIDSHKK